MQHHDIRHQQALKGCKTAVTIKQTPSELLPVDVMMQASTGRLEWHHRTFCRLDRCNLKSCYR
jgi:hypothetical protein